MLQGRDIHSIRVLIPNCRGVDQNFHDVTIVDMGVVPESVVSIPELSVPMMSIGSSIPLEVAPPADLAVGSPARCEILLRRVASSALVASSGLPPSSSVLCPAPDVDPPFDLAAMEQDLP